MTITEIPRRKKILVIDDDALVLKTVNEYLKEHYDVAVARSGNAAYRYLEDKFADLILIDYEMPGEKGTSVLFNIRKINRAASVPAVFLTGAADSRTVAEILATHPQGYILKPINKEKLIEKIKDILNDK